MGFFRVTAVHVTVKPQLRPRQAWNSVGQVTLSLPEQPTKLYCTLSAQGKRGCWLNSQLPCSNVPGSATFGGVLGDTPGSLAAFQGVSPECLSSSIFPEVPPNTAVGERGAWMLKGQETLRRVSVLSRRM